MCDWCELFKKTGAPCFQFCHPVSLKRFFFFSKNWDHFLIHKGIVHTSFTFSERFWETCFSLDSSDNWSSDAAVTKLDACPFCVTKVWSQGQLQFTGLPRWYFLVHTQRSLNLVMFPYVCFHMAGCRDDLFRLSFMLLYRVCVCVFLFPFLSSSTICISSGVCQHACSLAISHCIIIFVWGFVSLCTCEWGWDQLTRHREACEVRRESETHP